MQTASHQIVEDRQGDVTDLLSTQPLAGLLYVLRNRTPTPHIAQRGPHTRPHEKERVETSDGDAKEKRQMRTKKKKQKRRIQHP